jgi:hypothetical protein
VASTVGLISIEVFGYEGGGLQNTRRPWHRTATYEHTSGCARDGERGRICLPRMR